MESNINSIKSIKSSIKLNNLMSLMLHFFKRSFSLFKQVKSGEFKVNIHYKYGNEKFTEADFILQKMFENYCEKYFPSMRIIGEEDTSTGFIKESDYYILESEIDLNLIKESEIPESIQELDSEDLCLYIDPIDSTEQFIKRNFGPVTSLAGITKKTQAFIGFVYFPYYMGQENNSLVFFNIPSKGIFSFNTETNELKSVSYTKNPEDKWIFISSGSRTNETMKSLFKVFNADSLQVHGLGEKAVQCVLNDYVYLASGKGLGFWDVCSGHALVKEAGGGLYYLDGSEVIYPKDATYRNLTGVCFMTSNANRVPQFLDTYSKSNIKLE